MKVEVRRTSRWAPVPNKATVSVDVKQHSTNCTDRRSFRGRLPRMQRQVLSADHPELYLLAGHSDGGCSSVHEECRCALQVIQAV